MKKSKTQQKKTHRSLLHAAAQLMGEQGFDAVSMTQIAQAAGVGSATIYKYFASKEALVSGFFELSVHEALEAVQANSELAQFTLAERLQWLLDTLLQHLQPHRAFVQMAHDLLHRSPLLLGASWPAQAALQQQVEAWLQEAEAAGEIPSCHFKPFLGTLFADYTWAVVTYWLQDQSAEQTQTTQLLDLSLDVAVCTLQSGVLDRLLALGQFLLRSQLLRLMRQPQDWSGALQVARMAFGARP